MNEEEYVGTLVYDQGTAIPSIDMGQPIVRCKDCRFSLAHGNGCGRNQDIYDAEPDGFCAWGERREQ